MAEPDDPSPAPRPSDVLRWDEIPSTRWTLVDRAGVVGVGSDSRGALDELVRLYLPVLRGHLLVTLRIPADRVDDLLQGFIADKVLERNLIGQADAARGQFRRFLLTALNRYVTDAHRRDSAAKRQPGGRSPLSLADLPEQAALRSSAPSAAATFDRLWANEVLAEVMRRTRQQCRATDRMDVWHVLEARILHPVTSGAPPASHEQLAERLKLSGAAQSANILSAGKQLFTQVFRQVVGEYVGAPLAPATPREVDKAIDQEIRELWFIFAGPARR